MSDKFFNPLRIAYPEKFSNSSTNKKGVSKIRYTAPVGGRLRTACRSSGSKLHRKRPDPVVRPLFGRSGRSPAGAALFPHRAGVSAEGGQFRFGQVSPRRSVMPTVVVRSAVGACGPPPMPGAAVRFSSPPPHSCPASCVPVRMGSCGAVCRLRLPADFPAAASGVRPGAAVRFSPPPHSSPAPCVPVRVRSCGAVCRSRLPADIPAAASGVREPPCGSAPPLHSSHAPCVPVRMQSCGAVCRPRLPADLPAAAHRCRTSSAERTSFGGPNPACAHFRLRACAFVASVRCDAGRLSAPDPTGARRCPSESLFPPVLPVAAPCTGAGAERLSDEFFAPPLEICLFGKALEQRKYKRAVRNLSDSLFRIVFHC